MRINIRRLVLWSCWEYYKLDHAILYYWRPAKDHLSPMLFSLFISSIKYIVKKNKFFIFSDHFKLFLRVKSTEYCKHLNAINLWALTIGLSLNVKKFNSMYFYRTRCPIFFEYNFSGSKHTFTAETIRNERPRHCFWYAANIPFTYLYKHLVVGNLKFLVM